MNICVLTSTPDADDVPYDPSPYMKGYRWKQHLVAPAHVEKQIKKLMDEGVDTGKILLQKTCPVLPGDTVESLKARVQGLEREWYPRLLQMIEKGQLLLE